MSEEQLKELQIVKSDNHFYLVCDEGKHKIGKAIEMLNGDD